MTAGRVIWGLIVLVLGVLLLAANFGWIDRGFVLSLWQLWPLILVLIGIGLLDFAAAIRLSGQWS